MSDQIQFPSESRSRNNRKYAVAGIAILVAVGGAGVLARSVKFYIDHTVAEAVSSVLTDARIDGRARTAALDAIKSSPALVAESLNQYIAQQQEAVLKKEEDVYKVLLGDMEDATGVPVLGSSDAKVTVTYFFDANCPYCKQMDPILRPLLMPGSNVRVIYREIPILGPSSERSAKFASALWKLAPEKYDAFHAAVMNNRGQVDDAALDRIAITVLGEEAARGVAIAAARNDDDVSGPIKRNLALAQRAGIKGTPFFSVGGKTFFKGAVQREQFAEAVMKAFQDGK